MQLKKDFETGRNDKCSCGSDKKYKKCCLKKKLKMERSQIEARRFIEENNEKERYKRENVDSIEVVRKLNQQKSQTTK